MAYELSGKVKVIQDPQTFNSGFTKREMVVTVEDGKYPQDINLEFVQDKVSLLDALHVGQNITVTFDIRGREYNGRYFNNLQAWKIQTQASTENNQEQHSPYDQSVPETIFDDDIPF